MGGYTATKLLGSLLAESQDSRSFGLRRHGPDGEARASSLRVSSALVLATSANNY